MDILNGHPDQSPWPLSSCDAVGGIYTVIRSKAGVTTAELGDQYCMLGPYNEDCVKLEVEVLEPEFSIMKESIEVLRKEGVKVCSTWDVKRERGYESVLCFLGGVWKMADWWIPQCELAFGRLATVL